MVNMALLYYNKKEEQEWHMEAVQMMRRAALLGNRQAIEYLQDRGLYVTVNNLVDPDAANDPQQIAAATSISNSGFMQQHNSRINNGATIGVAKLGSSVGSAG